MTAVISKRPGASLRVAAGQFAAGEDWERNLAVCCELIARAEAAQVDLLVLPEGVLARFSERRERICAAAQHITGPFISALQGVLAGCSVTVIVGIHEVSDQDRPYNTLVALRGGEILQTYRKVHLYDAFASQESDYVMPADEIGALIEVAGFCVGMMTCYDVRFPEHARLLTDAGAEILALPAAWVKGAAKEWHWQVLVTARALENTVYVVAAGECGPVNIGRSMVVDPLGNTMVSAAEGPALIVADLTRTRLDVARVALPVLVNRRFYVDPTARHCTKERADFWSGSTASTIPLL